MSFASEIIDIRQLPKPCLCGGTTAAYTTTRTDSFSYQKKYRIQRNCLKSSLNSYELYELCINNTRSSGYKKGDYIQLAYGSPSLLLYISDVDSDDITGITIVNRPVFQDPPRNPLTARTLNGDGQGAIFSISVSPNRAACCTCGTKITSCA